MGNDLLDTFLSVKMIFPWEGSFFGEVLKWSRPLIEGQLKEKETSIQTKQDKLTIERQLTVIRKVGVPGKLGVRLKTWKKRTFRKFQIALKISPDNSFASDFLNYKYSSLNVQKWSRFDQNCLPGN